MYTVRAVQSASLILLERSSDSLQSTRRTSNPPCSSAASCAARCVCHAPRAGGAVTRMRTSRLPMAQVRMARARVVCEGGPLDRVRKV
jgi:hypothetical protein